MKKSKSYGFFLKMLPTVLCAFALIMTSCAARGSADDLSAPSSAYVAVPSESETATEDNAETEVSKPDTARVYELANGNPLLPYQSDMTALRSELTLFDDGTYALTRTEEYPGYTFEYRGETLTVDCKTVCYTYGGTYSQHNNKDGTVGDAVSLEQTSTNVKISVPADKRDAVVESVCEKLAREEDRERVRAEYSEKGYDHIYEYDDNEGGSSYRLDDAAGKAYLAGWKSYEITGYPVYNEQGVITRDVREDHISGVVWVTEYLYDEDGALTGYAETETAEEHGYLTGDHVREETNEYAVINGELVKTRHKVVYDGELTEEEYYTNE